MAPHSPLITEALEEIYLIDMEGSCPTIQKLLNEMMLIERECGPLRPLPMKEQERGKWYANGFKDKMLQTRLEKLHLQVPQNKRS